MKLPLLSARPALAARPSGLALAARGGARAGRAAARARRTDPVVARVNGDRDPRRAISRWPRRTSAATCRQMTPEAKRDYLDHLSSTDMMLVAKAAEAKKLGDTDGFQAQARLYAHQAPDGAAAAERGQGRGHRRRDAQGLRRGDRADEARSRRCARATSWSRPRTRRRRSSAELEEGRGLRRARQGEVEGSGLGRRRRSRLSSPRTRWCRNSPRSPSSSTRAQISDPVKSQFGWHVIKVEDKRERQPPEFEQVKDQIENFLVRKAQSELIAKLRAEAKIETRRRAGSPRRRRPPRRPHAPAGQKK